MNHIRSLFGVVAVSSAVLVGTVGGAASATASAAGTASQATVHAAKTFPSVCYEVENQFGEWKTKDQGCDGELVAPSGGVHGIAVTVDGVKQVLYSATPDGVTFDSGDNGDKVNAGNPTTKFRAALSPRKTRHLEYKVSYDDPANNEEVEQTGRDNKFVGDGDHVLNTISIRITNK